MGVRLYSSIPLALLLYLLLVHYFITMCYHCTIIVLVLSNTLSSAQQLKVSEDRLTVTGEKGYCLARATHSAKHGAYYFEVDILTR